MTYSIVTIRDSADVGDDRVYPEISTDPNRVVQILPSEQPVAQYWASALTIEAFDGQRRHTLVELDDHPIELQITDSRVTLGCAKFDTGGGWGGSGGAGLILAATANAVSRRRAAKRTQGQALVGQARYPWLHTVGAVAKTGFGTESKVRLSVHRSAGDGGHPLFATVTFRNRIDVLALAQYITQRAARWRLAHDTPLSDEERGQLTALLNAELLANEPGKFATYHLPSYYPASAATATLPPAPSQT